MPKSKDSHEENWGFETRAILKGQKADPATGATIFPIYQTSTFTQDGIGKNKGFCYSRTGNPTRSAAAECLAALEGVQHGFLYPSGIAAIHAVIAQLNPGDHIVACEDIYGGAHRLFNQILAPKGYEFTFVDVTKSNNVTAALQENTKLVWLESPSNPLMKLCDVPLITEQVKAYREDILVAVDNTFASPYIQRPFEWGVDIVMHSGTKYLGGHSDVLIGAVCVKDEQLAESFAYHQNATGSIAGPFDSWLLMKGMKTLALRMKAHHKNAMAIAQWLENHDSIFKVYCPALESSIQYDLYRKQMDLYNGMISFEINANFENVKKFVSSTRVFQLAESLGGVESLICHPASMTHAAVPPERRQELGIKDTLVRISVGIECIKDIREDLEYAFSKIQIGQLLA